MSDGILPHLRANSRNDSASTKGQPDTAGLGAFLFAWQVLRSLVGQCLSYLHSIWAPLTFHSTANKQCQSQHVPDFYIPAAARDSGKVGEDNPMTAGDT